MNWKEKAVAMSKLLLPVAVLFVIGMFLGVDVPPAQACAECLLEPCQGSGNYGWARNTVLVQGGYLDVFVHNPKCASLLGGELYYQCYQILPCGHASSSGLLFNLDGDTVTAFNVKSKKDAEALVASLNYQGLAVTAKTWKPRAVLSVEELAHPSIQTLAQLGLAQSSSCAGGK